MRCDKAMNLLISFARGAFKTNVMVTRVIAQETVGLKPEMGTFGVLITCVSRETLSFDTY
jgi:hypothetical protein